VTVHSLVQETDGRVELIEYAVKQIHGWQA